MAPPKPAALPRFLSRQHRAASSSTKQDAPLLSGDGHRQPPVVNFTHKDALPKHMVVKHVGVRRLMSTQCVERSTRHYDMSRYVVPVHSNVANHFTREFCAAGFSQNSQLTLHKDGVHTDTRTPPLSRAQTPDRSKRAFKELAAVPAAMAKEEE